MNSALKSFCSDSGIILEHSVAHMPEQNGVAERANQNIEDKLHTLIKDATALNFLWANSGAIMTYSINQMISASSGGMTPYEAFHGT